MPSRSMVLAFRTSSHVVVSAIFLLSGCVANPAMHLPPSPLVTQLEPARWPVDGRPATISSAGRMHGYVESQRSTDFCPGPKKWAADQRCIVTRGWDYSKGITRERTYDPAGTLISEAAPAGADLSLLPIEQRRVENLVRSDPRLAGLLNHAEVTVWANGFVYREPGDRYCDRRSRCIHVIAAANDGNVDVAHSMVDLMTDRVVYPFFKPAADKVASHRPEK